MKRYTLNFKGYWRECNKGGVPSESGIYLVYRCMYNQESKTVSLKELIYIGQSRDVKTRLATHTKLEEFKNVCMPGETLCYSFAQVNENDLDLVENALIFAQKPRLNHALYDEYNHDSASFELIGRCSLMKYTNFKIS